MHAGDSVSVLTQAKLPQVFRDEGGFDRRAHLAQQGIDLVAALRAPELLELVKPVRPGIAGWTSRARRSLGDEIDAMRTDRDGAVHILTDGKKLEISCFVACRESAVTTVSGSAQTPDQDQNRKQ
jgi:hypothetical protein